MAKANTAGALGKQLEGLLRSEAEKFVKGNIGTAQKLGESVVRAILSQEFEAALPGIPDTGDDTDLEIRAAKEEVNAVRSEIFQMVAKAEKEHAELVAQVRANAVNVVASIARTVIGLVGGFAAKSFVGA